MPVITYELIPGPGYIIYIDGDGNTYQDYDPEKTFIDGVPQPFESVAAAQAHAEAMVAAMLKAYEPVDPPADPEAPVEGA